MTNLNLGLIGNCQIAGLVDERANIVWACMPNLDSDPAFCNLLRDDREQHLPGSFGIELIDCVRSEQHYLPNTAILSTTLYDSHGGAVRITDLAPRFEHLGRMYRPLMLLRRLQPVAGR